nr:terpene synthase family protein [Micromonospora sp. DSM 115978]
ERLTSQCAEIWAGGGHCLPSRDVGGEGAQVLAAYRDCVERIAGYPAYRWSRHLLARAWRGAFASTVVETRWRFGLAPQPATLCEYLPVRVPSVFFPALFATALAASSLPPVAAEDLRGFDHACHLAGLAVRVANDLQSVERELAEGTPNAMAVLTAAGWTATQAASELLAVLGDALAELTDTVAELPA